MPASRAILLALKVGALLVAVAFGSAVERGANLIVVVDPFLPLIADEPGFNHRHSLLWVLVQDYKTVAYTRYEKVSNALFETHPAVTMLSFLPLYALLFQFLAYLVGAWMLTREYRLAFPLWMPIAMTATFLPYQLLLGISAVRAVWREARSQNNWEKTRHLGAHRNVPRIERSR